MFDQYEIIEEYRPSRRPMHLATPAEKEMMLRELRIMGSNGQAEALGSISRILGHRFPSLDSLRSPDAHKVIDHCQRLRNRHY